MKFSSLFSITGLLLVLTISGYAQYWGPDPSVVPKMISGGVLNGKATSLPKPAYPAEAKRVGVEGPVAVKVTIDEEGNVIDAQAEMEFKVANTSDPNGEPEIKQVHPALREAAETAARAAKFSPTRLGDVPVKVSGRIIYNFVAGGSSSEAPSASIPITPSKPAIPAGTVSGGVLNGKATYLPAPTVPHSTSAGVARGSVSVQVVIDESGFVTSAVAISGHRLLRASAVEAAKKAQFAPTLVSGQPVRVSGVLVYNFTEDR